MIGTRASIDYPQQAAQRRLRNSRESETKTLAAPNLGNMLSTPFGPDSCRLAPIMICAVSRLRTSESYHKLLCVGCELITLLHEGIQVLNSS